MADKEDNPLWSLVVWGVPALLLIGFGFWGIYDGWFRPGYEHVDFSRWVATPVGFAAGIYCIWRAIKEYRQMKSGAAGQGSQSEDQGVAGNGEGNDSQGKS